MYTNMYGHRAYYYVNGRRIIVPDSLPLAKAIVGRREKEERQKREQDEQQQQQQQQQQEREQ